MDLGATPLADEPRVINSEPPVFSHNKSVLLINLGTPSGTDVPSVRAYLREFLSDPYVIRLPNWLRWINPMLGRLIARFRAKMSAGFYRNIWSPEGSPLLTISNRQAVALKELLPPRWDVLIAMRYGQPSIASVLKEIRRRGVTDLVVIPMYPQFAGPSTGTALEQFYNAVREIGLDISITVRTSWYDDTGYIAAQAKVIQDQIAIRGLTPENTFLLFSAHSMPVSYIKQGDPYLKHINRTVELVCEKLRWPTHRQSLSFQSKLGPVEWLSPRTEDTLAKLAQAGDNQVLVCPISFTADCLESLEEIGIRFRALFEGRLRGKLILCPALNDHDAFISALRGLVLRGPQRAAQTLVDDDRKLSRCAPALCDSTALLMAGVSVPGPMHAHKGPPIRHDDMDCLKSVKISAEQVTSLLQELSADGLILEGWVLNTCNRFEVYACVPDGACRLDRETLWLEIMRRIFGERDYGQLQINTLHDFDAIHHLLRTTAGLNSVLPGETDIAEQLQAAWRLARSAGTLGHRLENLFARVIEFVTNLRETTAWGEFAPSYCSALLERLERELAGDWSAQRIAVIGRSTTCLAVLKQLVQEYKVPTENLTFIHKGSRRDGQIKQMRKLVARGRKVRVERYDDPATLAAVEDADLIIYGIDQAQPALDGRLLGPMLAAKPRQRTIVDFNTLGSTTHLEDLRGISLWNAQRIDQEVSQYAQELCADKSFQQAARLVEDRVEQYAGNLAKQLHPTRPAPVPNPIPEQQPAAV